MRLVGKFTRMGYVKKNKVLASLIKCGLISLNQPETDKVGFQTRPAIKSKYIQQPGLTADIGLLNEPLTYLDADTLLDVVSSTDGSGLFTFPSEKVANIKIPSDGSIFYLQESTGNTIADSANGRVVKLSAEPTFVDINTIPSQADAVGYTVSNGVSYFWDEALTNLIDNNVIIPNIGNISVAWVQDNFIYVTEDDYIYVTSDGFVYVTTEV